MLVTNVDSRRICTKQPLPVQENAAFVIQRSALKGKGDWLATDLGSFSNLGHSGKVLQVEDGDILASRRWPRRVEDRFKLNKDEYLVLSTYWKHAKYSDYFKNECKLIKFFLLAIAQSNSPLFCMQFSMESNH